MANNIKLPLTIDGGKWNTGHVQGIALDKEHKYVYYSFTTTLVKTDLEGNLIGTVDGLLGHLGCIDFNDEDGKLYGSLELKHDSIGQGIMRRTGVDIAEEDSFYIAIFDVEKIDRVGMDAEKDGVMTAVYLGEVVDDYNATDELTGEPHRYGCSGVDGTAIGPLPGSPKDSPSMLLIAYGIYGGVDREGNDNQVILGFDWRKFDKYAQPLVQGAPHHSGPSPDAKYFLYTGNTTWGIQNLEYDAYTNDWYLAVYLGKKPQYPNYPMYVIDGSVAPYEGEIYGRGGERGMILTLKDEAAKHESGISGLTFPWGQTGIYSFGDGLFYVSHNGKTPPPEKLQTCIVHLYRRVVGDAVGFEEVK